MMGVPAYLDGIAHLRSESEEICTESSEKQPRIQIISQSHRSLRPDRLRPFRLIPLKNTVKNGIQIRSFAQDNKIFQSSYLGIFGIEVSCVLEISSDFRFGSFLKIFFGSPISGLSERQRCLISVESKILSSSSTKLFFERSSVSNFGSLMLVNVRRALPDKKSWVKFGNCSKEPSNLVNLKKCG